MLHRSVLHQRRVARGPHHPARAWSRRSTACSVFLLTYAAGVAGKPARQLRAGDGIRTRDVQLGKLTEIVDSTPPPATWRHSSMISRRTAPESAEAPCPAA